MLGGAFENGQRQTSGVLGFILFPDVVRACQVHTGFDLIRQTHDRRTGSGLFHIPQSIHTIYERWEAKCFIQLGFWNWVNPNAHLGDNAQSALRTEE